MPCFLGKSSKLAIKAAKKESDLQKEVKHNKQID
jgi:hypothetical protein